MTAIYVDGVLCCSLVDNMEDPNKSNKRMMMTYQRNDFNPTDNMVIKLSHL